MKRVILIYFLIACMRSSLFAQIIVPPESQSICLGDTAVFFCVVDETGIDSINWQTATSSSGPWSRPMTGVSGLTNDTLLVWDPVYDGKSFRVTVWDMGQMVDSSDAVELTINMFDPLISFLPAMPKICKMGITETPITTGPTYSGYHWSTGDTTPMTLVFEPGIITVTVTDSNGCTGIDDVTVEYYPDFSAMVVPAQVRICEGTDTVLTAFPENLAYEWNSQETTQSILVNEDTTYIVTITDNHGCTDTASGVVNIQPNPHADFNTNPDPLINIIESKDIEFTNLSTPSGSSAPLNNWYWDFGDCASKGPLDFNSPPAPQYVKYTCPGTKLACLTVVDTKNCSSKKCVPVEIIPAGGPSVQLNLFSAVPRCLGDSVIFQASANISPVNWTLQQFKWTVDPAVGFPPAETVDSSNGTRVERLTIRFNTQGDYTIHVKAEALYTLNPDSTSCGEDTKTVMSGYVMPELDSAQSILPDFICEGKTALMLLNFNLPGNGDLDYRIDGNSGAGSILNGQITIPVVGKAGSTQVTFTVDRIQFDGNTCINTFPEFSRNIPIRPLPKLGITGDTLLCIGTTAVLHATGGENGLYRWEREGLPDISSDSITINANMLGVYTYFLHGFAKECDAIDSFSIHVIDKPHPDIFKTDSLICAGEVLNYSSNLAEGNQWSVVGGDIIGVSTNPQVLIRWNTSGMLTLSQTIGSCSAAVEEPVTVSPDAAPPFEEIVYLIGGGLLVYPNPDQIPGLCFSWLKDGLPLTDNHHQAYVVGTNLPDSELHRYSVEVYYCDNPECKQLISYRGTIDTDVPGAMSILLGPNPTSSGFTCWYKTPWIGDYSYTIHNCTGRHVQEVRHHLAEATGSFEVNVQALPAGLYFFEWVYSPNGARQIVPFIKF